jgi:hypothetical protein
MPGGLIPQCKKRISECHWKCCTFTDNYIVFYPGEYEASPLNKSHLKIVNENYHGGKKAICTKHCTAKSFKPLDCKTYPFFPIIDRKNNIRLLKGIKCPLTKKELAKHKSWVLKTWKKSLENEEMRNWLKKVKLVGYKSFVE